MAACADDDLVAGFLRGKFLNQRGTLTHSYMCLGGDAGGLQARRRRGQCFVAFLAVVILQLGGADKAADVAMQGRLHGKQVYGWQGFPFG